MKRPLLTSCAAVSALLFLVAMVRFVWKCFAPDHVGWDLSHATATIYPRDGIAWFLFIEVVLAILPVWWIITMARSVHSRRAHGRETARTSRAAGGESPR